MSAGSLLQENMTQGAVNDGGPRIEPCGTPETLRYQRHNVRLQQTKAGGFL